MLGAVESCGSCFPSVAGLLVTAAAEDWRTGGIWVCQGCSMSEITSGAPSCVHGLTGTFRRGVCVTCHRVCHASAGAVGACWKVSRAVFPLWLHKSDF